MNHLEFLSSMGWALSGFILHILTKMTNAKRVKKDFRFSKFWERNWLQYVTSFAAIYVYVSLATAGHVPQSDPLTLVALGYGGGSLIKNILKRKEDERE